MRPGAILALLLPLLVAVEASAKPITIDVARTFDEAWLAAEVEILDVEIGAWAAWGGDVGKVRVRVTSDPARIYRGLKHLGRTLELKPEPTAAQKCTVSLQRWQGSRGVLLVVSRDRRIVLGGEPEEGGYVVRGWYDHDACRLRSSAPGLGGPVRERQGSHLMPVARAALVHRYRETRQAFYARVARFLDTETPRFNPAEVEALIEELGAGSSARRKRAQALLGAQAQLQVAALGAAEAKATDPEVRRCLRDVLEMLTPYVDAEAVARRLPADDFAARRYVVREGLSVLRGAARDHASNYLERIETRGR